VMEYKKYAEMLLSGCKRMVAAGMTVGTWGNISVRIDEDTFMITPSGIDYSTLNLEDFVIMNMKGEVVSGKRKPSIEHNLHRKILQNRKDVNAVIHAHAIYSTAFAIAKKDIPAASEELVQIVGEGVRCAKYALLVNHGAVFVGPSLDYAFIVAQVVEKAAQTIILSKLIGEPNIIPHEDVIVMRNFLATKYGQK